MYCQNFINNEKNALVGSAQHTYDQNVGVV